MTRKAMSRLQTETKEQTPWFALGVLVLVLTAAAVVAGVAWQGREARVGVQLKEYIPAEQPFKPQPFAAPTRTLAASSPSATVARVDAGAPSGNDLALRWRSVLEAGTGLRAFVQQALQSPGDGGMFYALTVVEMCEKADIAARESHSASDSEPAGVKPNQATHINATAALQRLQAECSQFTPDEFASLADEGAAARKKDPLVGVFDEISGAGDEQAALANGGLQRAMAKRDPALLHALAPTLGVQYHPTGQMYFHLAGTDYTTPEQTDIAFGALALLPCSTGVPCERATQEMHLQCLQDHSKCYANQLERVSAEYAKGDAARLQEIRSLYERLVAAVKAGDVSAFLRKDPASSGSPAPTAKAPG